LSTLLLGKKDIRELIDINMVIDAVEDSFLALNRGAAQMPPKTYLHLDKGDFRAMPAALPYSAGIKWVNVHPQNYKHNLPTVMAVLIYSNPETGYPLAIMDASEITAYRTGAASGIASKFLARHDSKTLGIVGAGRQAYAQVEAHMKVLEIEKLFVYDINSNKADCLIEAFPSLKIEKAGIEETAGCDIVCTATPSRGPIIYNEWIKAGAHINAIGADAPGKQELDPEILNNARVIVDDISQAMKSGEINVAVSRRQYDSERIKATLGQVISGQKRARENNFEITVFDSTGIAIQDIAVAGAVYNKAILAGRNNYLELDLFS